MDKIDIILLDVNNIILPLSLYLLYTSYSKTFDKKENELVFVIAIFTMIYMIFKFAKPLFPGIPLIIINIPLVLAYLKKSKLTILFCSILIASYYMTFYQNLYILVIAEYVIYYLLYLKDEKKLDIKKFIIEFCLIKMISLLILNISINGFIPNQTLNIVIISILLFILTSGAVFLHTRVEDVLKLHMSLKEIEHDKEIKSSLFQITHEIKNPIAVCKGYLDMFDVNNQEHAKKYIPILKEEINRTLLLLEDFLAMNKIKINKEPVDINLLLEDVIKNTKLLFNSYKIKLETNLKDDEIYISGDYNRLVQVFINLLKNSCEADGVTKIKIWTKINNDQIKVCIEDNGVGMDKETLNKIKEPFYTTKARGTGLGVSLSDEIITAHQGILNYTSRPEKYTRATVILPIEKAF